MLQGRTGQFSGDLARNTLKFNLVQDNSTEKKSQSPYISMKLFGMLCASQDRRERREKRERRDKARQMRKLYENKGCLG